MTRRLADPVLNHLAAGTLKARMPVEQAAGADRGSVTHLEALGRLVAGIAPWLELSAASGSDAALPAKYADLARRAIARAVDPVVAGFHEFRARADSRWSTPPSSRRDCCARRRRWRRPSARR